METCKVIIVGCTDNNFWYKDFKGKMFRVYGTIEKPYVFDDKFLICVDNSFNIHKDDVIFIKEKRN